MKLTEQVVIVMADSDVENIIREWAKAQGHGDKISLDFGDGYLPDCTITITKKESA